MKKFLTGMLAFSILLFSEIAFAQRKPDTDRKLQSQKQQKQVKKRGQRAKPQQQRAATGRKVKAQRGKQAISGKPGFLKQFNSSFNQLKKAYRQNDREKMGKIINKMDNLEKKVRKQIRAKGRTKGQEKKAVRRAGSRKATQRKVLRVQRRRADSSLRRPMRGQGGRQGRVLAAPRRGQRQLQKREAGRAAQRRKTALSKCGRFQRRQAKRSRQSLTRRPMRDEKRLWEKPDKAVRRDLRPQRGARMGGNFGRKER